MLPGMKIEIKLNLGLYDTAVEAYLHRTIKPAQARGLNAAAELIKADLATATKTSFNRPRPFTQSAFAFFKATARKGKDPDVKIRVKSLQARYFEIQVHGGVRRVGDYSTTSKGSVVPGKGAKLNAFGGLPRRFLAQQEAKKDVFWEERGKDNRPTLFRREKDGTLKMLAVIVPALKLKQRFDFYGIVRKSADKHVSSEVKKAMRAAIRRAGAQ